MVGLRRDGRVFLVGLVLVVLVTACGSDGDRLSEEEFLAQANEICRAGNTELEQAFEALFPEGAERTDEEFRRVAEESGQALIDDYVSNVRGQIADIRALKAPSDLEVELGYILDEGSELLDQISGVSAYELLVGDYDPFTRVNSELRATGLTACAG
jgi:hypothetical protein